MSNEAYEGAVHALFTQLPMFQRQGPAAYKANLNATKLVCGALGNPQNGLRFVHVAGTNGKGTVCHMVSAVLQESGHRVGLFTSPHLVDFRERIRVNGVCIPEQDVAGFVERWQSAKGAWGTPSFFELTFGMALDHFRRVDCDIVVLETGMGGRLDSTNVIAAPEVSVVTNVGMDHQAFLGSDIRSIAKEKAGIFKQGAPVVLGPMRPEAQSEMLSAALRTSSEVHFARDSEEQAQPHLGRASSFVTRANIGTALATLNVLQALGWDVPKDAQCRGLSNYPEITGQKGRWERVDLPAGPTVVFDGAHNVDSVAAAVEAIESFAVSREGKVHVIWGAVADKDHSDVMALLPTDASYTWCAADIPRAMKGADVAKLRPELGGEVCESPAEALRHCIEEGLENDVIWVGGSLFVVGDALRDAPSVVPNWPDSASSDNPA